jgi:chaperonin GroEL (HSP60 family)
VVKVTGIQNKGRTATVLLRGSNKLVLEEAERSLHDALCVVRCLVHKRRLLAGGSAPEVEIMHRLSQWSKTLLVGVNPPLIVALPVSAWANPHLPSTGLSLADLLS